MIIEMDFNFCTERRNKNGSCSRKFALDMYLYLLEYKTLLLTIEKGRFDLRYTTGFRDILQPRFICMSQNKSVADARLISLHNIYKRVCTEIYYI